LVREYSTCGDVASPAWSDVAARLAGPEAGRVLVLPLNDFYQMPTTWGYYGADTLLVSLTERQVVQRQTGSYLAGNRSFDQLVGDVETFLLQGNPSAALERLRTLGVRYIVLRHDLAVGFPGRTFTDPARLAPLLDDLHVPATDDGVATVYDLGPSFGDHASLYAGTATDTEGLRGATVTERRVSPAEHHSCQTPTGRSQRCSGAPR